MEGMDRVVRDPERRRITGLCRSRWRELEQDGRVPRRRRIGPRAVGWLASELQSWMREPEDWPRMAGTRAGVQ